MALPRDRFLGSLLGLAVGDALGAPIEFLRPGQFAPVTGMRAGGLHGLPAGYWTDDSSMALCLAESLILCHGHDPKDQMDRYAAWWKTGHLSSTGFCFDIGATTRTALARYLQTNEPYSGSTSPRSAGNGSIMRLAPAPMFWAYSPSQAIAMSMKSSMTTHKAATCIDACRYLGGMICGALRGETKEALLEAHYSPLGDGWKRDPLCPEVAAVAGGSFKHKAPPDIVGSGYVVDSLEAALWALHQSDSFEEGALLAVNLGDDADTTGAVYGQLAGALYGASGIPQAWLDELTRADLFVDFADKLFEEAQRLSPQANEQLHGGA